MTEEQSPPSYEEATQASVPTWRKTHPDAWTHEHAVSFLRSAQRSPNNFVFCYVPSTLHSVLHALRCHEILIIFLAGCGAGSTILTWWMHAEYVWRRFTCYYARAFSSCLCARPRIGSTTLAGF